MVSKAIITIVQNGNQFLPIWYRYYSKDFDSKDIYIFDYGTTDGSLDGINANIIKVENHSVEVVPQGNKLINELKAKLLQQYGYVVYADYDEIIHYEGGWEKLLALKKDYYTTQGYEIVQNRAVEGPIDWSRPILEQRSYWYRCEQYDKSLITRINFNWAMGNHSVSMPRIIEKRNGDKVVSRREENNILRTNHVPGLYLLHLHKVDYQHALDLHHKNAQRKHLATVGGMHNFFDGDKFEQWYKEAEAKLTQTNMLHLKL